MIKLVFIGKNLNQSEIQQSFEKEFKIKLLTNTPPPPSFSGLFLLVVVIGFLLYPGEVWDWANSNPVAVSLLVVLLLLQIFHSFQR